MSRCPYCNKTRTNNHNYCDDCGKKIHSNNIFHYIEFGLSILPFFISFIYVITSSVLMHDDASINKTLNGLYIVLSIPLGLIFCIPQFILGSLGFINLIRRSTVNSLMALLVCFLSILTTMIYRNNIVPDLAITDALYGLFLTVVILLSLVIIFNGVIYFIKNKE